MPRRYAPDGTPLFNGKSPEDLSENETRQFIADTEKLLNRKDFNDMATNTATATATQAPAEVEQQAEPIKLDVTVRPIEPRGKMIGFASVNFGGAITVHDFRIFNGEKGLFVTPPSVKDESTRSGYRDIARLSGDEIKTQLNIAVRDAYIEEVQKLQARAAAVQIAPEKPRIKDQLEKAGQEAAKDNAARPAPEKVKDKADRNDR